MAKVDGQPGAVQAKNWRFESTHWSVVRASSGSGPEAEAALESLCRTYWYPLYAHARRKGKGVEDAEDLVQELFLRFLDNNSFASTSPEAGKFRNFMLASLDRLIVSGWRRDHRLKRGGGTQIVSFEEGAGEVRYAAEAGGATAAEGMFDRDWALAVLEEVMRKLRVRWSDKLPIFEELRVFLGGTDFDRGSIAIRLGMSEGALNTAIYRLRQQYRQLLKSEIAHTVARPQDVEEEMRTLIAALA